MQPIDYSNVEGFEPLKFTVKEPPKPSSIESLAADPAVIGLLVFAALVAVGLYLIKKGKTS